MREVSSSQVATMRLAKRVPLAEIAMMNWPVGLDDYMSAKVEVFTLFPRDASVSVSMFEMFDFVWKHRPVIA